MDAGMGFLPKGLASTISAASCQQITEEADGKDGMF